MSSLVEPAGWVSRPEGPWFTSLTTISQCRIIIYIRKAQNLPCSRCHERDHLVEGQQANLELLDPEKRERHLTEIRCFAIVVRWHEYSLLEDLSYSSDLGNPEVRGVRSNCISINIPRYVQTYPQ